MTAAGGSRARLSLSSSLLPSCEKNGRWVYLFKSLKRTSPPKLSTISPNPSQLGVQLVHGIDTDPAEMILALGVPVSES